MSGENTEEQLAILRELAPVATAEALSELLHKLAEPMSQYVPEVMEPDQGIHDTEVELKDVYLLVVRYKQALALVSYDEVQRTLLRDAIVACVTLQALFSNQLRFGEWRPRPTAEVVQASQPWRRKLRTKAGQAFFFQPTRGAPFQDHNETGTVEEEVADLRLLVDAAGRERAALALVGFTDADHAVGERLLAEAEGRDNLALLGIRNQVEMKIQRDRHLTLAVLLGRYARATGESAFVEQPDRAAQFTKVSFRNALRRLRPARTRTEPAPTPVDPPEPVPA